MEYKKLFQIEINYKSIAMLGLLAILPNLLGLMNLPTVYGFQIHTFPVVIFIAAAIYGPLGGAISGGFGSIFSAFAMGNPYLIIGNIILGLSAGFLFKKGLGLVQAAMLAYVIQMPWLFVSDVYFHGMPVAVVYKIMLALLITDFVWAIVAKYTYSPLMRAVQ